MVTETSAETNRPYAPPSNVAAVLRRLQSRNLPERVGADYLRDAGVSGGTVGRTLFALRFLGLITDEAGPTQPLRAIHTATAEEYQSILAGLIRNAYADVFNVIDPSEDGQGRILNVFRRYTPASQQSRMVIFFLGMCREAGIPTLDVPRQRSMQQPRAASKSSSQTPSKMQPRRKDQQRTTESGDGSFHPALDGLVRSLPSAGQPVSDERLEQWLTAARATLRFIYPEEASESAEPNEHEED